MSGIREKLVKKAMETYNIEGKFGVLKQIIFSHIKAEQLKVWYPRTQSPALEVGI
jgi:hypothetical protein